MLCYNKNGDVMKLKKGIKKVFILVILVLLGCGGWYLYQNSNKEADKPSSEIEKVMKEKNIDKDKYSKTLEYVLLNNIYDEKFLDEYQDIEFNNETNFSNILTTFLPKGYKGKEINYILKLSDKNVAALKELEYIDISNYYKIKNFNVKNIERYNKYKESNKDYSYENIVTYVNIKLDLPVYTDVVKVKDPDDLLVLVNKYNCLPDNYKPDDIVYEPGAYGNNVPMRKIIQEPFQKLQKAAKEEGINFKPSTAFRNQSFQATLYNKYVNNDGKEAADRYSARPGCSEHQTGLSIDLRNINLGTTGTRLTEENYNWLKDNAYKYGFIIRFPQEKEFVTGYIFENWHIRYVGEKIAKIIHNNDLTLEEYIDLYVTEY